MSVFDYLKDADSIVTITMNMTGPVNAINQEFRETISATVDRLEQEENLTGVVLASAKKTFFAGGDLNELANVTPDTVEDFYNGVEWVNNSFRRLEKLEVPVVAAINGAAMGGGLELSLACNRRIIVDDPRATVGCPEVTLGLLPGGGGVVRSIHMVGVEKALPSLLAGKVYKPAQALEFGYVDEIVTGIDELIPRAREWIKENPDDWQKPWDKRGHKIPGGDKNNPKIIQFITATNLNSARKTRGLLPAPQRIISIASDTIRVDFDTASRIESRGLAAMTLTSAAKNIITTMFFQMGAVKGGASRPAGYEKNRIRKVGVLGAGMMGGGIACSCALAGVEVVIKDISIEAAEKGKAYTARVIDTRVELGRFNADKKESTLALIKPTVNADDLAGCDLIIETVFEDTDLKAKVTQEAEPYLAEGGVFGTNTSTLPITLLSEGSGQPEKYIGLHFFSPVDRMPLIELICGEKTSDETLARAFDFAQQIRKTPIVVNDSVGFYTSRTFDTFLDEGARLLKEGLEATLIDNLAKQAGMPMGPLEMQDIVTLDLAHKIAESQRKLDLFGSKADISVSTSVCEYLINDFDRHGRSTGGGYYDYPKESGKVVWPKLYELFHKPDVSLPNEDVKERFLFRQAIETVKCLQEGVLPSVADGNIGSSLGIGAPAWTGGWLQIINTYQGKGVKAFAERAAMLAQKYGKRFEPPALLLEKAETGEKFI